ncbi:hypothetical protein [Paraliomyxa miuraensis]|uniref:hypothetical protein n=1 Tax=Paraliomyxa miuraensis TaxID=376150 RepID=UPI0022529F5A|nr:hypothetical protein [Paraliomyxa miuraensis]MCX4242584.1 hypothetical protein [Paraliomyxa miuraensis]
MERGRVRLGFSMLGSFVHASHDVEPDQREPDLPLARQPAEHVLDIGMLEWDLDAQLGVSRRFAIELMLPVRATIIDATFLDGDGQVLPGVQSIHHRDETIAGVGDLLAGIRVGAVLPTDVPRWTLALRTGVSLPTGNIEPDPFVLGAHGQQHQHMFFGSGTVDPMIGFDTNVAFDRWSLVGWTMARSALYANQYGYRGTTTVVGGVGAWSGLGLERWSFLVQPEVFFETPARWSGVAARNSGRTSLLATAGLFFVPAPRWQLHLLGKIPYATWSQGGQLEWPFVALIGMSATFDMRPPEHHH